MPNKIRYQTIYHETIKEDNRGFKYFKEYWNIVIFGTSDNIDISYNTENFA